MPTGTGFSKAAVGPVGPSAVRECAGEGEGIVWVFGEQRHVSRDEVATEGHGGFLVPVGGIEEAGAEEHAEQATAGGDALHGLVGEVAPDVAQRTGGGVRRVDGLGGGVQDGGVGRVGGVGKVYQEADAVHLGDDVATEGW